VVSVHFRCSQCFVVWLHSIDVCLFVICVLHMLHVHGPGFCSMSPASAKSAASHVGAVTGVSVKTEGRASILGMEAGSV